MKNYIYIVLMGLIIFACDDYDESDQGINLEELPAYVAFDVAGTTVENPVEDVDELGGSVEFTVEAPTGTMSDITVNYEFGGDAVFGQDFTVAGASAAGGSLVVEHDPENFLSFDEGSVTITLLTDAITDGDKTLTVTLVSATNGEGENVPVGRGGTSLLTVATVNIADVPLEVSLSADSIAQVENSMDTTFFDVSLNYAAPADVTVNFNTSGGLVQGGDFSFVDFDNPLVIPAGETSATFSIVTIDDVLKEDPDSLLIVMSGASIGGSGLSVALTEADTLEYVQYDEMKTLGFSIDSDSVAVSSVDEAGFYSFPVTLDNVSTEAVTIDYTVSATGGAAGVDYVDETGGSITFNPGQTKVDVTLQLLADAFSNASNVEIEVELTEASLTTTDAEVEFDGDRDGFKLVVVNE